MAHSIFGMALKRIAPLILLIGVHDAYGQSDFYGKVPAELDPPISQLGGTLQGNGTASGILPAEDAQSGQLYAHVVFFANSGDDLIVDTNGSTPDTKLAILFDVHGDGIQIGDAPRNAGNELSFEYSDDDGGQGSSSLVSFNAPYRGAYLASISEFDDEELTWQLHVSGSTYSGSNLACDLDGDGLCNVTDIDLLYKNGDAAQVTTWLTQASAPTNPYLQGTKTFAMGDANLDGNVDSADLGLLLNNFGSMTALNWGDGNLDGDAAVASTDLGQLLNRFGHQSLAIAVPEPGCLLPLAWMACLTWARRRRK